MARGLNKVFLLGNLGADPEIKYTPSGTAIATLNLATSENRKNSEGEWEEKTEWNRIVMFGRQAEFCKDYVQKGKKIFIEGRIQTRSYEDQNGQKHYITEIIGSNIILADSKGSENIKNTPEQKPNSKKGSGDNFPDEDDDLPF
jgi:single-strand DNA-binding protein